MKVGMAVNSGQEARKQELATLLDAASFLAIELGLWVEGKPFDVTLRAVANQLGAQTTRIHHGATSHSAQEQPAERRTEFNYCSTCQGWYKSDAEVTR